MDLTFASLYSGCGGLDLGLARAGMRPVWANDIDPDAVATYNLISKVGDWQWQRAVNLFRGHQAHCGDIEEFLGSLSRGTVHVIAGGPPCQGYSQAGKMDPADPRSQHVFTFMAMVAAARPRAFIMENVSHLARSPRWRSVIDELSRRACSHGYRTLLTVLDAAGYGVPQHRERMFLIGLGEDVRMDPTELMCLLTWRGSSPPLTAREALDSMPMAGEAGNDQVCKARVTLARNPVLRRSPFAGMLFNGQGRPIDLDRPAPTLPATMGGNRTPVVDLGQLHFGAEPWVVGYHRRLFHEGRPPLDALPPEARLRRLTLNEAARIQSFPRGMNWQGTQAKRFRQVGNAVPPYLAWHVGKAVVAALRK